MCQDYIYKRKTRDGKLLIKRTSSRYTETNPHDETKIIPLRINDQIESDFPIPLTPPPYSRTQVSHYNLG